MTSLQLVDLINKDRMQVALDGGKKYVELLHKSFLTKVKAVLGEKAAAKFISAASYEVNNAKREHDIYILPKREASLLAMSYSYELQARVYDHMTVLVGGAHFQK